MRQVLNVDTKNYSIVINDDNFTQFLEEITSFTKTQKVLFVVSKKVYSIYKNILKLDKFNILVLKDGEKEKNYKNYLKIIQKASEIGLSRNDALIALGGGVIGDITGFAASTYLRGIDYIQVPTTLLSMVDSSVGGKTAINTTFTKNIIGTFYQPKAVFININFLNTLDKRQYLSGIGEILKYAFIEENCNFKHSLFLFEYLTLSSNKLLEKDPKTLMKIIEHCLNLKISVVNQDEKEADLRKVLNLGHTYGHAIEVLGNYKKYLHGEAVVQGMFFIFNYAYANGLIGYSNYRLAIDLLNKYGFKTLPLKYKSTEVIKIMKKDKKAQQDKITFIVPADKKRVKEITLVEADVLKMF